MLVSVKLQHSLREVWMLKEAVFSCVGWLCGKRNFARRRRLFPYTFFYQRCGLANCVLVSVDVVLETLTCGLLCGSDIIVFGFMVGDGLMMGFTGGVS
jgi:hypothetical protein